MGNPIIITMETNPNYPPYKPAVFCNLGFPTSEMKQKKYHATTFPAQVSPREIPEENYRAATVLSARNYEKTYISR